MELLNILWIGDGAAFFPFLNCTDLNEVRYISKEVYHICKKAAKFVTFYGLSIPKLPSLVYDLFYGKYASLEKRLQKNEDFTIQSVYHSITQPFEHPTMVTRGATKFIKQWNGLVLMEIAYMLGDDIAVEILKKYKRNTCHVIRSFTSTYGFISIRLLERCSEENIKNTLMSLRPPILSAIIDPNKLK